MIIDLSPMRRDDRISVHVTGDILTINGEGYDFSAVKKKKSLLREKAGCLWLASDVKRVTGKLHLALILPHGAMAPLETRYPEPVFVIRDGQVALPDFELGEAEGNPELPEPGQNDHPRRKRRKKGRKPSPYALSHRQKKH